MNRGGRTEASRGRFVSRTSTSVRVAPPAGPVRVFWAVAEGACAAVLLYAGGKAALTALQAAVVSIGLPFCVILLLMVFSLIKSLRAEVIQQD